MHAFAHAGDIRAGTGLATTSGMKRLLLLTFAAFALAACERRDGKIIIDEKKADEAIEQTGKEAKNLGEKANEAAKKIADKAEEKAEELKREHPPDGVGGGPKTDAGTDVKPDAK